MRGLRYFLFMTFALHEQQYFYQFLIDLKRTANSSMLKYEREPFFYDTIPSLVFKSQLFLHQIRDKPS